MTIGLYDRASALLHPPSFTSPAAISSSPALVPAEPGIYGWWIDEALSDVPRDGVLTREGRALLYVGIAPSGAIATTVPRRPRNLRDRLKNHCRGPLARSTLRRTLAALLSTRLGLEIERTAAGKLAMPPHHEALLSNWMSEHAAVAWMVHPRPWELEVELISSGPRLPLNIAGSTDQYRAELSLLRQRLGRPV
jgi:hypothetical protein